MIGIVLVGHCHLAHELHEIVKRIVGDVKNICSVNIEPNDPPEESIRKVGAAIKSVDAGNGVLVLTDMFGGTPSNLSLSFLADNKVEVLTGMNLPMIIRLVTHGRESKSLADVAQELKLYGQQNICIASEILHAHMQQK
ncbi:MAG: hypothetical protein N3B18_09270 [Desulfobacterota bacterium]|nr:hypothetical protein [Thermodesulfobacteriota bacterium]